MATDPLSLVDPKYLVNLKGKSHPTYPGVLEAAMKQGLLELSVKLIQAPTAENGGMAICEATACFPGDGRERIFVEIGDADGHNCGSHIAPHRVRMAATRAKGRALRDALGIGIALAEEMSDERETGMERAPAHERPAGPTQGGIRRPEAVGGGAATGAPRGLVADESDVPVCMVCGSSLMEREISGCAQAGWPLMCYTHAREYKAGLKMIAEREAAAA